MYAGFATPDVVCTAPIEVADTFADAGNGIIPERAQQETKKIRTVIDGPEQQGVVVLGESIIGDCRYFLPEQIA